MKKKSISLILAIAMIVNLLFPAGQLTVKAEEEHDYYWYHTDTMGEDAYDLECAICGENFGRGYKYEGYYYMYDANYTHNIYTEDGDVIGNEVCEPTRWFIDETYHEASCKCHVILVEEEKHTYDLSDICTECGYEKDSEESGTIDSEIMFVEESSVVSYSGEPIGLNEDDVNVLAGTGAISFNYYSDEECTERIDVPSEPGKYYVKAIISAHGDYSFAMTEDTHVLTIRPRRVSSLTVSNASNGIKLSWKERVEADGYIISRRPKGTSASEYEEIAIIEGSDVLSYTDKDIIQGKGYVYTIKAYSDAEDGTHVEGLILKTAKKIIRVKVTSVTNQNGSIKVKWTKLSGVAGYKVYRKSSGDDAYKLIKTIKDSSVNYYTDKSEKAIKNGKASYYYVKPYLKEDDGYVRTTNKKTHFYLTRPTISSVTGATKAFTVKWKKNSKATGYQIRYSKTSSFDDYEIVKVADKETLSKKISSLSNNKKYYVQVRVYKTYSGGSYYSAWSASKSVTTKASSSNSSSGATDPNKTNTVYTTETGKKYHCTKSCTGLNNANKIYTTTLSEAKDRGLTACSKCY